MSLTHHATERTATLRPLALGAILGVAATLVVTTVLVGLVGFAGLAGSRAALSQQAPAREAPPPVVTGASRAIGSSSSGIPYEGTGLAAQIIRGERVVVVHDTGIPYVGSGPAAAIIRGASAETVAPVVGGTGSGVGSTSSAIPYVGSGPASEIIRASLDGGTTGGASR